MRRARTHFVSSCLLYVSSVGFVCAGLASCTSHPADAVRPTTAAEDASASAAAQLAAQAWTAQQRYADAAMPFELLGKVGMPRGSANIRWRQADEQFELRLWGPFGAGAASIRGDVSAIRFERDGLERAGDPAEILSTELGWRVPVGALSYWVRGLPAPLDAATALELREGRLAHVEQAGWSIAIDRYQQQPDGGWLPARLTARQADVRFTLVVQSWAFGPSLAAEPGEGSAGELPPTEAPAGDAAPGQGTAAEPAAARAAP